MNAKAPESDFPDRSAAMPVSSPSARHVSIEERRRLVAESLKVGNPGNNARELPAHSDPSVECQVELAVDEIRPYESNPRRAGNAKFAEIKESIRASGIRNPLTVTRRPGETHFIVEAGGNTRLVAIQQLWVETRDPRFRKLTVLFRPWRSESHVLTSHLIENEQRGEMAFWDKAAGIVALKGRLEAEKGRVLSLRQLGEELTNLGLSVNTATLAHYLFAIERLRTLGEAVPELSGLDAKTMQPRLNALKRYAHARASLVEEDLYARVFEPVFRCIADEYPQSRSFSAAAVCEACEEALARELGEPVAALRGAVESPARSLHAATHRPVPPVLTATPPQSATERPGVSTANNAPSDAERVPSRTGRLAGPRSANPFEQLVDQVRHFAAASGIDDCVRLRQTEPLGFCVEALSDPQTPVRYRAWRVLATISGQFADAPQVPLDAALFDWLVDADDAAANAFWQVLSLLRESRGARDRRGSAKGSATAPEGA